MHKILLAPFAAVAAGCAAYGAGSSERSAEVSEDARGMLEQVLRGRLAEAPIACIPVRSVEGTRSVADDLLLYEGRGDIAYLNRTRGSCNLRPHAALIRRTTSPNVCAGEIVNVYDPVSGVSLGSCSLGEFTPYRRAR